MTAAPAPKPGKKPWHDYHCTLNEVAAAMGLSRSRVQQIERCALQKVKAAFEARGITAGYLDEEHTPEHWPPDLPG